jgi:hypothetical protein
VKVKILSPLLLMIGLGLSGMAAAAAPAAPAAPSQVYSSQSASGSIELTNLSADETQEPVATAPAAANTDNTAAAGAEPAAADAPKDPREQYRDKMLQAPEVATPATTNASRRYKMMDLATYRANVLGGTAPAPQGDASAAR